VIAGRAIVENNPRHAVISIEALLFALADPALAGFDDGEGPRSP